METETLSLESLVSSSAANVTVVARLYISPCRWSSFAIKQPIAVIVADSRGKTMFSTATGEAITIAQLGQQFPRLKKELESALA